MPLLKERKQKRLNWTSQNTGENHSGPNLKLESNPSIPCSGQTPHLKRLEKLDLLVFLLSSILCFWNMTHFVKLLWGFNHRLADVDPKSQNHWQKPLYYEFSSSDIGKLWSLPSTTGLCLSEC